MHGIGVPSVSVLMASHRVDEYLLESVECMLSQSYADLELVFVANGVACQKVSRFLLDKVMDTRLVVIETPIAQLAHALNLGLGVARGKYIARMDCDDLSDLHRIEEQLKFLKGNDLDLVGCNLLLMNEVGEMIGRRVFPKGKAIDRRLPFSNPFAHNSILVKKSVLIEARGYNAGFNSEDYDLWFRLKRMGVRWDNMPDTMVSYRIHQAAAQRRLLGYAESCGLAMREFVLHKSLINFVALGFHFFKALCRPQRR